MDTPPSMPRVPPRLHHPPKVYRPLPVADPLGVLLSLHRRVFWLTVAVIVLAPGSLIGLVLAGMLARLLLGSHP